MSSMSSRSHHLGPLTVSQPPQAAGLFMGRANTTYEATEILFEDPPNTLFAHPRAATEYLQQHQMQVPPPRQFTVHAATSQMPSSTRLLGDCFISNYSLTLSASSPSSRRDVHVSPGAPVSAAHDTQLSCYTGLPTPEPTPTPPLIHHVRTTATNHGAQYTPHSTPQRGFRDARPNLSPLTPLVLESHLQSPHARSDNVLNHTRRASSSRAAPYPSPHARQSFSNQGSFNGSHYRKHSTSDNVSRKRTSVIGAPRKRIDWSRAKIGQELDLTTANRRSHTTIDGFEMSSRLVICAPRSGEYTGGLDIPGHMIEFCVNGRPGPSIASLVDEVVHLDGESDQVFKSFGWRTTKVYFDWPGLCQRAEGLDGVKTLTRAKLASIVASSVAKAVKAVKYNQKSQVLDETTKRWDLRTISLKRLRLVSLNYYRNVWVPILAYDVD